MDNNRTTPSNEAIAKILDEVADLLEVRKENPFRIGSYRKAAQSVRGSGTRVARLLERDGAAGLRSVGGIGEKLAGLIQEYVESGTVKLLEDLKSETPAAARPASDAPKKPAHTPSSADLSVDVLLEVDQEYLTKAKSGKLKMIAPKKLNPDGKAWLPLLSVERKGWKFTVMFSNTARAHELGKTNDWVVLYYEKGKGEQQCTVVTEQRGPLKGKRVIRGREAECRKYYEV